ncbi:MAG: hypothetical protein KDA32_06385 [Phycisphaerales bacterium]|nr:hypothetical protein [Phycisphaerales bacterium]
MPERLIRYESLSTPRDSGATLVEPADVDLSALAVKAAATSLSAPLLDTTIAALRDELRAELGLSGPIVAAGHQAEFSHAGVFAKRIACDAIAAGLGTRGVYVMVDSDTPKSDRVALPPRDGETQRRFIEIPGLDARFAMSSQAAISADAFRALFDSLADGAAPDAILPVYRDAWLALGDSIQPCDGFEAADAAVEAGLGMRPLRVFRVSSLAETRAFRAFASHWLLNAERLAQIYNNAQAAYRRRHKVRTPQRPVPPLARFGYRIETPFWIKRRGSARQRLFALKYGNRLTLFADEAPIGELAVDAASRAATHDAAWSIEQAGWLLRPRALSLSAFMRLFLSDLFIHGIGGAKYDEVTEGLVADGFGVDLPPLACVTATLRLREPSKLEPSIAAARHAARDARYNPQRHLNGAGAPRELLAERDAAINVHRTLVDTNVRDQAQRRAAFDRIHAANAAVLAANPMILTRVTSRLDELERRRDETAVAADREYFYGLHARSTLESLARRLRNDCGQSLTTSPG